MQERERGRLQKMGRSSLQTESVMHSRKKRSFSLPSLTRRPSSAAGERQDAAESAEAAARVQKAAAWQWYTRGVGEAVLPTKRSAVPVAQSPPSPAPSHDTRSKAAGDATPNNNNVLDKKPIKPAPLAESPRAASRFKAEAVFARPPPTAGTLQPTPPAPSAAPNSTPLYDEFELSGLRTQMADFVQRLQSHGLQSPAQKPLHVPVQGRPLPAAASVSTDHQPPPAAPAISSDHQLTKPPPPAAAAILSDHQLTKPPPSAAPVASTIPFHRKPFSALHRLFRKVVSSSILKSTKNSPQMTAPAVYEPEVLPDDEEENTQHHFHHYIHHHHHHYHYGESPEESATITSRRRRHSESSSIRPQIIPSLLEAESDEEEEEAERSAIEAYLYSRRRHSDSFTGHLNPRKAAFDEEEEMKVRESAMASQLQFQRRYNSERFTPNKIPTTVREELAEPATDKCDEEFPDIRSRRRHSAENEREGASLERKAEGGGKSGGGTYKLGGGGKSGGGTYKLGGGGKSGEGTYKLGGGDAGAATAAIKSLFRRRHSEGLQRPEGVHYASPGRAYRRSPSARYLEDVLPLLPANADAAARPPRPPPNIYRQ